MSLTSLSPVLRDRLRLRTKLSFKQVLSYLVSTLEIRLRKPLYQLRCQSEDIQINIFSTLFLIDRHLFHHCYDLQHNQGKFAALLLHPQVRDIFDRAIEDHDGDIQRAFDTLWCSRIIITTQPNYRRYFILNNYQYEGEQKSGPFGLYQNQRISTYIRYVLDRMQTPAYQEFLATTTGIYEDWDVLRLIQLNKDIVFPLVPPTPVLLHRNPSSLIVHDLDDISEEIEILSDYTLFYSFVPCEDEQTISTKTLSEVNSERLVNPSEDCGLQSSLLDA